VGAFLLFVRQVTVVVSCYSVFIAYLNVDSTQRRSYNFKVKGDDADRPRMLPDKFIYGTIVVFTLKLNAKFWVGKKISCGV
jgi:hypothetical protein